MSNTIKVKVEWACKQPNVIAEPYRLTYELLDQNKVELIQKSDAHDRDFFLKLWSAQIIQQRYPEHCKVYQPVILSTVII